MRIDAGERAEVMEDARSCTHYLVDGARAAGAKTGVALEKGGGVEGLRGRVPGEAGGGADSTGRGSSSRCRCGHGGLVAQVCAARIVAKAVEDGGIFEEAVGIFVILAVGRAGRDEVRHRRHPGVRAAVLGEASKAYIDTAARGGNECDRRAGARAGRAGG